MKSNRPLADAIIRMMDEGELEPESVAYLVVEFMEEDDVERMTAFHSRFFKNIQKFVDVPA